MTRADLYLWLIGKKRGVRTLGDAQKTFSLLVAELIRYAYDKGYSVTLGDAYRDPIMAQRYAECGVGIADSLHIERLAIDLNLFRRGKYLTDTKDYECLGTFWEGLHQDAHWGGHFARPDGGHFSLAPKKLVGERA